MHCRSMNHASIEMGGSETDLGVLHFCLQSPEEQMGTDPQVTVSACLHRTPCPPTARISTGERHLSPLQSLFTFLNAS